MDINSLPKNKKIFFAGIGGLSLSALAQIMRDKGYEVLGYDDARGAKAIQLEELGIPVFYEINADILNNVGTVIRSDALGEAHKLIRLINELGLPIFRRAELLAALTRTHERTIAVSGTHGKSTTSGMLSQIFLNARGCDPTVLVGADIKSISTTYKLGSDGTMIFESDEYKDTFLEYYPSIAVVLNVSYDHTDHFASFEATLHSFSRFLENCASVSGCAVINNDDKGASSLIAGCRCDFVTYSAAGDASSTFYAQNIEYDGGNGSFDVYSGGVKLYRISLSIPGYHNISNALAAVAVCNLCKLSKEDIINGIKLYTGVGRRFDYKGRLNGAPVYDDYAHHPDEIRASLDTAKRMCRGRVISVFQPHTYSRLRDLFDSFAASFYDSDITVVTEIFAARETNSGGLSGASLACAIENAVFIPSFEEIEDFLTKTVKKDDLVLFMGAGSITSLAGRVVE